MLWKWNSTIVLLLHKTHLSKNTFIRTSSLPEEKRKKNLRKNVISTRLGDELALRKEYSVVDSSEYHETKLALLEHIALFYLVENKSRTGREVYGDVDLVKIRDDFTQRYDAAWINFADRTHVHNDASQGALVLKIIGLCVDALLGELVPVFEHLSRPDADLVLQVWAEAVCVHEIQVAWVVENLYTEYLCHLQASGKKKWLPGRAIESQFTRFCGLLTPM